MEYTNNLTETPEVADVASLLIGSDPDETEELKDELTEEPEELEDHNFGVRKHDPDSAEDEAEDPADVETEGSEPVQEAQDQPQAQQIPTNEQLAQSVEQLSKYDAWIKNEASNLQQAINAGQLTQQQAQQGWAILADHHNRLQHGAVQYQTAYNQQKAFINNAISKLSAVDPGFAKPESRGKMLAEITNHMEASGVPMSSINQITDPDLIGFLYKEMRSKQANEVQKSDQLRKLTAKKNKQKKIKSQEAAQSARVSRGQSTHSVDSQAREVGELLAALGAA